MATPITPTRSGNSPSLGMFIIIGFVIMAVAATLVGFLSPMPPSGKETGAVIALTGSLAVGIERALELFWTFINFTLGKGWPFGFLTKPIRDVIEKTLPEYLTKAQAAIEELRSKGTLAGDELKKLETDLASARQQLEELKAQGTTPSGSIAGTVLQSFYDILKSVQGTLPKGHSVLGIGQSTLDILDNLLGSFKDNPARRAISVFASTIIGMIACALSGVDVFNAIFGVTHSSFQWGVVFTGVLIGLGSDPAHQIIRVLEESKSLLKSNNARGAEPKTA